MTRTVRWRSAAAPLVVWGLIAAAPAPAGLPPAAWSYFALFVAVIVGLILEPLPAAAVGFLGVTAATVLRYVGETPAEAVKWGLRGFSDGTVWLIFGAFMLSMGYEKTGLGRRVALLLVKHLGRHTLGLGYAIALADLVIAPGTPSNTARSAGTIYPVIRNIPPLLGSEPGPTARRIGGYLMWTAFASTAVTSSMFLTALAPNPLAVTFVRQVAGQEVSWVQWLGGFLPVGILLLLLTPWLAYLLYPPEIKRSDDTPRWAADELAKLGPVNVQQWLMALLVVLALGLWIFGRAYVSATTVVLIVISLMLITNLVDWSDLLDNRQAWNVLVWFATLVTLADGLNQVGFVRWAAEGFASPLARVSPMAAMALLVAFFFLSHYLFASLTAHAAALLPVLLAVGQATDGLPMRPYALLLCYSLGLMGVLTPYATGPAPVYYASGYITRGEFWRLGLVFGLIFLAVLLAVGIPYLSWFAAAAS